MNGLTVLFAGATLLVAAPAESSDDYFAAYRQAETEHKLLLIDFGTGTSFGAATPDQQARHVVCRLTVDATLPDSTERIIDHACFRALGRQPGLAIVDLTGGPHHGDVVSVLPHSHVTPQKAAALLALPSGTLTQRTLTWAFLIHPERPQSVQAAPCPQLMAHCARHSGRQASMNNQHHDMNHPGRSEIVAESWPWNKNVVDAAIDIVWSWRQSPGHWSAASQNWNRFGYDMKTNGEKWYATGVFQ